MPCEDMALALKVLDKAIIGVTPIIDEPFLKSVRHFEIVKFLNDNFGTKKHQWIAIDDTPGFLSPMTLYFMRMVLLALIKRISTL